MTVTCDKGGSANPAPCGDEPLEVRESETETALSPPTRGLKFNKLDVRESEYKIIAYLLAKFGSKRKMGELDQRLAHRIVSSLSTREEVFHAPAK
jgi:hypothetical protein